MNRPITSYPCAFSKHAATELSTPPLIASTTRCAMFQSFQSAPGGEAGGNTLSLTCSELVGCRPEFAEQVVPRGSIRVTSGGRTASRSQPQLADLVANRFGRAGPTKLHIMTSGQTTRPRATGSRSTSIMPHGSRFGQSRSPVRSGSQPAPPRSFQPTAFRQARPTRGDHLLYVSL